MKTITPKRLWPSARVAAVLSCLCLSISYVSADDSIPAIDSTVVQVRNIGRDFNWSDKTPACYAKLNDSIIIDVMDLQPWLDDLKKNGKIKDETVADLVPFFNGVPLPGVHPENPLRPADDAYQGHNTHHLRFTLARFDTDGSRKAWSSLLNQPVHARRVQVSVGFENGIEIPTWVDAADKHTEYQFFLAVVPTVPVAIGAILIGGALVAFAFLARKTDIIRDTTAEKRPDGYYPISLGRVQMAFWFFIVITAFFLLWVITGETDTINNSTLALIGISAGTALSAAIIDGGKRHSDEDDCEAPSVDSTKSHRSMVAELNAQMDNEKRKLQALKDARASIQAADTQGLAENNAAQVASNEAQARIKKKIEFFKRPPWKVVAYDLLADDNAIAFHRFQIFIWTLVLGVIFVSKVYNELAMPEFSATMLGLLGVSAGTYLGFKFPEKSTATRN
jgi:hypothetical protein